MAVSRPIPLPDLDDEAWWKALQEGRLTAPWCTACERSWLRPTPTCPRCGSSDWEYRDVSQTGSLYTWVTVHRALDDSFADDVPYTVVVVELDGGARVNARLLGVGDGLSAGARVVLSTATGEGGWPTLVASLETAGEPAGRRDRTADSP